MQTIYTLITQAYCGTVTVMTLVTSFLDRTLAEEALKVVESVNEHSAFQVHCHIKESKLIETRDEVDLFNPEFFEQRKAEITKSGNEWRERKRYRSTIISLETQQIFADALGITLEQYIGINDVPPQCHQRGEMNNKHPATRSVLQRYNHPR